MSFHYLVIIKEVVAFYVNIKTFMNEYKPNSLLLFGFLVTGSSGKSINIYVLGFKVARFKLMFLILR